MKNYDEQSEKRILPTTKDTLSSRRIQRENEEREKDVIERNETACLIH